MDLGLALGIAAVMHGNRNRLSFEQQSLEIADQCAQFPFQHIEFFTHRIIDPQQTVSKPQLRAMDAGGRDARHAQHSIDILDLTSGNDRDSAVKLLPQCLQSFAYSWLQLRKPRRRSKIGKRAVEVQKQGVTLKILGIVGLAAHDKLSWTSFGHVSRAQTSGGGKVERTRPSKCSALGLYHMKRNDIMKALTVGGAMVDTIAIVDDELIERISLSNSGKTFLLLEQGSKTEAADISTHCGGGAINAAVALARLGFDVSVLAKVGADERARLVRETLTREKISPLGLRTTSTSPTGASAIISAHDRNAAVFTFRGANTGLRAEDIEPKSFEADLVYIASLSGASADALPSLVQTASNAGAFVSVNPGIKQITTRFEIIRRLLSSISLIAVNRSEAEALVRQAVAELSGSENAKLRQIAAASLHVTPEGTGRRGTIAAALVEGVLQLGAQSVLLTDGRHGSYYGRGGEIAYCPALDVPVASTVGAGDAFVSTFCATTVMGEDAATALRAAAVNSASVVGKSDTQSGLLSRKEVAARAREEAGRLAVEQWPLQQYTL